MNLQCIVLEEGIEEIGEYVFSACEGLRRVVFPQSLKKIGAGAFFGCNCLEEVVLPNGLEEIGKMAFDCCPKLNMVNIPSKAKIGEQAFWDYWQKNRKCGYCGSARDGDGCSDPNCIGNKEIQK